MTDSTAAMVQMLTADTGVTALVPVGQIGAGVLPQGTALPFLSVELVSSVDRNIMAPGATRRVSGDYAAQLALAAKPDCPAPWMSEVAENRNVVASKVAAIFGGRAKRT